ncbi:MAG: hypothetical protein ACJ8FY_09270 [Gemmataceae bacterium]
MCLDGLVKANRIRHFRRRPWGLPRFMGELPSRDAGEKLAGVAMRDIYLGDSYDLVKRYWSEQLGCVAPLYAHPRFIQPSLHARFITLTTIPILDLKQLPQTPYGLFFDPHTGIPIPDDSTKKVSIAYAPLPYVAELNTELTPQYMICFDQSIHRKHKSGFTAEEQREAKRSYLRAKGIFSFYYISHASFLFMAQELTTLRAIRDRLIALGIPEQTPKGTRLQTIWA